MTTASDPLSVTPETRVGFIGIGTMGAHMARHLANSDVSLVVNDLDRSRASEVLGLGATWAGTPAAVAEQTDLVFTSLPGPAQVREVALGAGGLGDAARDGLAYFDLSTNSPTVMREIHQVLGERGVAVLDAPVSGGPYGAEVRKLAVWVGGDRAVFDRWQPVIDVFADAPHWVGDIGAASVAKLVHNLSGYIIQTALAETFTLGVKAGVDPAGLWEAVRLGANGRRRTFDGLARNFLANRYDPPDFALELAHKDVSLACALGREFSVPMRLSELTLQELTEARNRGWDRRDSRSAMTLQSERAGVHIEVDTEILRAILDDER